jgi:hypothetical protein
MVEPARRRVPVDDSPPIDPRAIDRAYHLHRARRQARLDRRRNNRRARLRFWIFLLVLLALAVFLAVTVWHQVQRLFGL